MTSASDKSSAIAEIGDMNLYRFSDLIDVPTLARVLESIFRVTGIPNAVVDASGVLLASATGDNACAMFHGVNPQSASRCRDSNLAIMHDLRDKTVSSGLCRNGLMDYVTPVIIEGKLLATLCLGQVLHAPPDLDFFRAQAEEFGFNEKTYLEAIAAIPIVDRQRMQDLMVVMVEMTQMLAANGLSRLREAALARDISSHVEYQIRLQDILEFSPIATSWADSERRIEYVNRQFTQLFGYTLDDLPTIESWDRLAYPDELYRVKAILPWREAVALASRNGLPLPELEANVSCKDGSVRRVVIRLAWVGQRQLVSFLDITERGRMELALKASESEFRTLAQNLPDVVVRFDRDARFIYANPKFEAELGVRLEDVRGKTPTQVPGLQDAAYFEQMVREVVATGSAVQFEHKFTDADGHIYSVGLVNIAPEFDDAGQVNHVQKVTREITDRWCGEQRMRAHDAMLGMVARGAELAEILEAIVRQVESEEPATLASILLLDEAGRHLLIGAAPSLPAFYNQAIHGLEIGVGVGSCGTAAALGERVVVEDILTHAYWKSYTQLARDAGLRACWSEPIISPHGKVLGTFALYHNEPKCPQAKDIERIAFAANLAAIAIENRYARKELERRAYTDYLTGLANRRHFLEQAENELVRTVRYGREMSILMLDVDHFKQVNDTYGHKVGDLVLIKLSELCRASLRDVDVIGRIGGEEFAVLLPETGNVQAMEAAERLRAEIASAQVALGSGLPLRFTASFGVTTLRDKEANIDMLLNQADQALYQAKNAGRNRVCVSDR